MSAMVSAQGYSLTNKVLQLCNGWLMEARRPERQWRMKDTPLHDVQPDSLLERDP
jgi:hypothetical protein